jgi:cytochrome c oxidase subunit 2
MNKYLSLALFAVFLLVSGFIYQTYYRPAHIGGASSTGETVAINMRVLKNQWKWEPNVIKVASGDKVILNIYNEDTYDHGFAIDVFGVNRRLFPQTTTVVEFTPSLTGKFNFYCSVPCGEGHYDQIGTFIVGDEHATTGIYPNKNFACKESSKLVNQKQRIVASK